MKDTISVSQKTYRALELSILKWELIVQDKIDDKGSTNCMLCQLYDKGACITRTDNPVRMNKCPVYEDVGEQLCRGTPYQDIGDDESTETKQRELDYLKDLKSRCEVDPDLPDLNPRLDLENCFKTAIACSTKSAYKSYLIYDYELVSTDIVSLLEAPSHLTQENTQ